MTIQPEVRTRLRQFLEDRFSLSELNDLAFDFGIDLQSIPHQTAKDLARELIACFEHRDELSDLVDEVLRRQPDDDLAQLFCAKENGDIEVVILKPKDGEHYSHMVPMEGTVSGLPDGVELWEFKEYHAGNYHPDRGPIPIKGNKWFSFAFIGNRERGSDQGLEFTIHIVAVSHESGRRFTDYLDKAHLTGEWPGLPMLEGKKVATVRVIRDDFALEHGGRIHLSPSADRESAEQADLGNGIVTTGRTQEIAPALDKKSVKLHSRENTNLQQEHSGTLKVTLIGPGAIAQGESAVAAGAGGIAVGHDVHGPVVVAGQGAQVTVTIQGENVRDKEMVYLAGLLARYEYWHDRYTPLAGITEVRAAVEDGPHLGLPTPFIPPGFEKLVEYGYGERAEVQRVPVDDLREAVAEHRRIVLLGEPGSGKTTTLWRLAYDYAQAARDDSRAPLPVLVPLSGYTDSGPFDAYLARYLGPLAPYLWTYQASGRLILLLDGLNEMPWAGYEERVGRIRDLLDWQPDEAVVVTCRALDYVVKLEGLQKVEILPLDEARIRTFLHNYLGDERGERLFWTLVGGSEARTLWETWKKANGTWDEFWTAREMPENIFVEATPIQVLLWKRLRRGPLPMLELSRNPYLLRMTVQVYDSTEGKLPANRAQLFAAFVSALLERERKRCTADWMDAERQQDGLAALAFAMQVEGKHGTTVDRTWAVDRLAKTILNKDVGRMLHLTTDATLLDATETTVRFHHQLIQEYFAACELRRRMAAGESLARFWPPDRWWEPSGWEETAILLTGMEENASELLERLARVNPVIATRCLLESGAQADEQTWRSVTTELMRRMAAVNQPPITRAQAGRALAHLGDPRPGVGLRPDGLPDIAWCEVPAGPFTIGSLDDSLAFLAKETPQHQINLPAFRISKYLVTNAQYAVFLGDGGYHTAEFWREAALAGWWREGRFEGHYEREARDRPFDYGSPFDLPNHPVVGVTWYEAVAFCRWLTERLQSSGDVRPEEVVTLPSEAEWEKAARGMDGRVYPWGDEPDPNRANFDNAGIGTTSAVGCFPDGASSYDMLDLSGNVWEWTRSVNRDYPYNPKDDREDPRAEDLRVLRGGSFNNPQKYLRCACRHLYFPYNRINDVGFRVVVVPDL